MNKQLSFIFVSLGGLFVALYVIMQVMLSPGNVLGSLYKYFLPISFILGLLLPRFSVYLLIILAIYIDLAKKFMVIGGDLYFADLFFILGIPPVLLLGACISRSLSFLFNRDRANKDVFSAFVVTILLVVISSAGVIATFGVSMGVLKILANTSAYFGLIFLISAAFDTKEDVHKLIKFLLLLMAPAACYGLYHYFVGLNDFEWVYLESGFSTTAFYAEQGEGVFGTFSSQGALSAVMITSACLCLSAFMLSKENNILKNNKILAFLGFVLFFATAVLSLKRGPILTLPFFLMAFYFLKTPRRVFVAYIFIISTIISLVIFGIPLAENLADIQIVINKTLGVKGETAEFLTRVRTLNVRLLEFGSLGNIENWTAFGIMQGEEASVVVHSKLVSSVYKLGYVPLVILCVILMFILKRLHKWLNDCVMRGHDDVLFFASLSIGALLPSLFGFGNFNTFPVLLLICIYLAVSLKLSTEIKSLEHS
ncbi:MAG: hypothetical protein ACSHX0_01175 [Akkermansiaceae bacterium]